MTPQGDGSRDRTPRQSKGDGSGRMSRPPRPARDGAPSASAGASDRADRGTGGGRRTGRAAARSSPRNSARERSQPRSPGDSARSGEPDDGRQRAPRRGWVRGAERRDTTLVVSDDVTGRELDADVRRQLRTLPTDLATKVARHLVMAGRLLDEDPDTAYRHAAEARRLASRVPAVREAAGLSAYAVGRYADALTELRAATRMSGRPDLLPLIADAERGVGRPERALSLAASEEARRLPIEGRVEMAIVASGARRDLGQPDAAVVTLQIPELRSGDRQPWFPRLAYAYADALDATGRRAEALTWLRRAVDADADGHTGAAEWWDELHGVTLLEEPEQ
jgi:tetratricopeptide (TPR) repeat protein